MSWLELQHLHKRYGEQVALHDLNLQLERGEIIAILGASGCGKSTLLRCINGLEPIQGGTISLEGKRFGHDISWQQARQKVGMVFQNYELFHHLSVWENLLLAPVRVQGRNPQEVGVQAEALLERVGLASRKHARPRELSGGQKQRIAIVRALCMNPELLLLDEITAALDPEMVREVLAVVLDLSREGMTMLLVTHELGFAKHVAQRVLFMDAGRIVEDSPCAAFFERPRTERGQQFLQHALSLW